MDNSAPSRAEDSTASQMSSTFIYRRWQQQSIPNTPMIDSKPLILRATPSMPPTNGSSPLLRLPTELRLQIYRYLTINHPGRLTKPNAVSRPFINLLQICQRMRAEILDDCFADRTFVVEASLYKQPAGGLCVLPQNLLPSGWVKRLLILTVVESGGKCKGIADLRSLQQMTGLKDFRIVFTRRDLCALVPLYLRGKYVRCSHSDVAEKRLDDPTEAVFECVLKSAKIEVDMGSRVKDELLAALREGIRYLFADEDSEEDDGTRQVDMKKIREKQGHLSGSEVDHSRCSFADCDEGLHCVNSRCGRWYDALDE
ncbi:uncharacterized protein LTR77_002187 [Saxophila tyrrhenica]|uniref:F-box domain-containing protein n=1 Tax=Saxophila tyrrhenica TaxID=1690608 RepID=A0AAV9PMM6_9PEZI|nr:hypothetical protein LTR77_002187 [Saxophila tyrrhenica]